jgi:hypothetical protein
MADILRPPARSPVQSSHDLYNHDLESPLAADNGLRERKKFDRYPMEEQTEFEVVVETANYDTGK